MTLDIVGTLRTIVGDGGVLDAAELSKRSAGTYRFDTLKAAALVRPTSTQQVSEILRWCHANGVHVVTHGGLTGLVHGADAEPSEVILSLERMRTIEEIDPKQRTAVVQAGVPLQALQDEVDKHDLAFPLDLGSRGTATLGGNAATNAGGNRVIRYGMTRDMILGLEVVLADGTVLSSLNHLIKNNAGYDLKQLFIGSEGTLGVITRLVLRLREKPLATNMAFVGLDSFDAVAKFLKHCDRALGGTLSAFEVMWQSFYRLITTAPAKGRPPIGQDHAYYVLVESQGSDLDLDSQRFTAAMETALESGLIADAAIAQSDEDCRSFWALRDDVGQVLQGGLPIVFDVSLPIAAMEGYAETLRETLESEIGEHRLWIFGHLGDGNLHVVVQVKPMEYLALRPKVEALVYRPLAACNGSVSAEHGVGLEKKPYLYVSRSANEIALMRTLKLALDPKGILNPGKIFDPGPVVGGR
ncbi:FAD-binding oxidoreductase [Rhodopseudomonas sp. BR0M22]|uniref:FAD-binding oxidoreductase n=1 Tax=Rhodopseudomonas sp. BR0M22 TaxID=2269369 RepID=UPI0013E03733|nr:FAD-binding oxidoreductase [Rhodopseudomonas sp. BR0M22]NEW90662.1 FAD-binding oxidoreductase [Rhodopseudomonas sp. BR0M22]